MTITSAVSTLTLSGTTGSRTWTATAAVQDTAAGAAVTITLATSATGTTPPAVETSYTLYVNIDNTGTTVHAFSPGVAYNGTVSFSFTLDGTSAAAARAGLLRMVITVSQTAGLAATQYNGNTDAGGSVPTGFTWTTTNSGFIRGTTTAVTTLNQATYAYGDAIVATTTLGAVPYQSETVDTKVGSLPAVASTASTTTVFSTSQGAADNRFPASSSAMATVTTIPNAALVSTPWTVATATEASSTVDPRITIARILQINDNTFGTPPMSKSIGTQRLTSDLGFIDARFTNASGVGINGLTYNGALQDGAALTAALTRTGVTTVTEGGQDGWGNDFLAWDKVLPGGAWNHTATITYPASAVGLESPAVSSLSLVSANPNYRLLCAGGPATVATDARHFSPGVPLLVGMALFDTHTTQTVPLDTSPVPSVALGRFNLTFGRAEFLAADGTWKAATGANTYYWPCTVSPGDPNAWTATFTSTSTWSDADLFVIGRAYVGGVPVSAYQKEVVVNGVNNHDTYAFDGPGFVGFPTR